MDAQENTRMTISRWLRMKADEELRQIGREEGIAEGIAESNKAWDEWLRKMREAQRDGKPFDEPPPSSRR